MTGKEEQGGQTSIFLSHRHNDKAISDVLRKTIANWSTNAVKVFQSSHSKSALIPGDNLVESLQEHLADSNVVFLIYTTPDEDWSWCMWECGVATDPKSLNTRIVVFDCLGTAPDQYKSKMMVQISEESILAFTEAFHKSVDFFPRLEGAFAKDSEDDLIRDRAAQLFLELSREVSKKKLPPQRKRRWHYLRLSMEISPEELQGIRDPDIDVKEANNRTFELVQRSCFVTETSEDAVTHFGYDEFTDGMSLWDLFQSWKSESDSGGYDWFTELCKDIARVIRKRQSIEIHVPMKSAKAGANIWYLPVVNHAYLSENEELWGFHVELYRIPSNGRYIKIVEPSKKKPVNK